MTPQSLPAAPAACEHRETRAAHYTAVTTARAPGLTLATAVATEPQINDAPGAQPLVSATVGDRCVSCGTPMSSDQRYCVACGERRGKPRFSLPAGGTPGALPSSEVAPAGPSASPPAAHAPRASSGTTIVAGVGTLLLAMGVGVLIGRNSADNVTARPVQAAAPTVVTVGGGAGTATTAASATNKRAEKTSKSKGAKANPKTTKASKPTAAQAANASNAASQVLGSSNKNLPPATVTVGQTGHGPGYDKSGKFDGSFFGQ